MKKLPWPDDATFLAKITLRGGQSTLAKELGIHPAIVSDRVKRFKNKCNICANRCSLGARYCKPCSMEVKLEKIPWPDDATFLAKTALRGGQYALAKELGINPAIISQRVKRFKNKCIICGNRASRRYCKPCYQLTIKSIKNPCASCGVSRSIKVKHELCLTCNKKALQPLLADCKPGQWPDDQALLQISKYYSGATDLADKMDITRQAVWFRIKEIKKGKTRRPSKKSSEVSQEKVVLIKPIPVVVSTTKPKPHKRINPRSTGKWCSRCFSSNHNYVDCQEHRS